MLSVEQAGASHRLRANSGTAYFLFWVIWLPFLIPGIIQYVQSRPGLLSLIVSLVGAALFVAVYLRTNWESARDLASASPPALPPPVALWTPFAVLLALALGLAQIGGATAWGSLFIFTAVTGAGRLPVRQALAAIALVELLVARDLLSAVLSGHNQATVSNDLSGMALIAFASTCIIVLERGVKTSRELQAAREEIAHLAHERVEQELNTARQIQQSLLPKEIPTLAGWHLAAYYQPAREVGGDFYDFLPFPDGRLGLVLGDVTDKGVPAALVMATTRSMLRAAAQPPAGGTVPAPGAVLAAVNELLVADLPPSMFVTCFYAILDPASGRLRYANAGQDLPYLWQAEEGQVGQLRARGMPLGLMSGMVYEEQEAELGVGDRVLFYSDGLVEAHNAQREMFDFPRLASLLGTLPAERRLIEGVLDALAAFVGPGWEQEDDVTLVTLQRTGGSAMTTATTPVAAASRP